MKRVLELFDFKNQTALVTGGAGHIATEFCILFSHLGGRCVIVDKNFDDMQEKLDLLSPIQGGEHVGKVVDLGSQTNITEFIEWFKCEVGKVNVLVNNVAFTGDSDLDGWTTDFAQQSIETWNIALTVNLTSCFQISQGLAPLLAQSFNGNILNIASIYGALGPDLSLYKGTAMGNPAAYAASKGGLIQLTRWLATVLSPNIRVNCISAGGVERGQNPLFIDRYKRKVPIGRMAKELEIANAMIFLCSDMASYITGQNLFVDGGYSAW